MSKLKEQLNSILEGLYDTRLESPNTDEWRDIVKDHVKLVVSWYNIRDFTILGLYQRPDSIDPMLIDIMIVILTLNGMIVQYNIVDTHVYRIGDKTSDLADMKQGILDSRRYNYQAQQYIKETSSLEANSYFCAPYKAFDRPKIVRE